LRLCAFPAPRRSAGQVRAFALNLKDFNPQKHNKGKLCSLAFVVFRAKSG
jgi:hypothetical protein